MRKEIWLINPYDAIPGEKWGYKHGMFLADSLSARGYSVIYWTSSFAHAIKTQRSNGWEDRVISPQLTIRIVPSRGYTSHVGLRRVMSLFDFARGVLVKGLHANKPDCLVVSIPNLFGDIFSVWLARKHKAALIIDFRDLWPEIFMIALPKFAQRFSRQLFAPLYWMRAYAFRNADGLTSVCETYRQLALRETPTLKNKPNEVVFHTGVELDSFRDQMANTARDSHVVMKEAGTFWAIYAGTIGNNYDIETLLQASTILHDQAPNLKIIVAGNGPLLTKVQKFIASSKSSNVVYVGVLDMPTLCRYYAYSDIGLSIYSPDSTVAIPAKAFDYFASELPIVNSVVGEFEELLMVNSIGFQYRSGDPISLADVLTEAVSNPSLLFAMKERLSKLAPSFDRKVQYNKLVDLIERVLMNTHESSR
jgi:glycosyltransferase involved in cell wall biosynthesis